MVEHQLTASTDQTLAVENAELRARVEDLEDALRAIRKAEVDALVIESAEGSQIYMLQGVDAESNRFRGEILSQVSDAVIAVDGDQRVTYLNAAAERQYGVLANDVLGNVISKVYESCTIKSQADADAALNEHGKWRGESIHIRRDGHKVNVESSVTILPAIIGHSAGWLAVIRDISDRKQAQEKLRVSEIRYRRLFEAAQDGVLLEIGRAHV